MNTRIAFCISILAALAISHALAETPIPAPTPILVEPPPRRPDPCICPPWNWELSFEGGNTLQNDLTTSPAFQVNPSYRVITWSRAALKIEAPFIIGSSAQVTYSDAVTRRYRSFFFTPSLNVVLYPTSALNIWFSGGAGPSMGIPNPEPLGAALQDPGPGIMFSPAIQAGAGIDINPFKTGLGFRLEARDFYSKVPSVKTSQKTFQNTIIPSGGIVFRF